jgi:hydrogenase nickel incorporation protein HypA/HybF
MHELSIAQSIISIVEKTVPTNKQEKVRSVKLQIGTLSGIEIDALTYSFSIIRKSTQLINATLDIDLLKGLALCSDCKSEFEYLSYGNPCPKCNGYQIKIVRGKEMKVISIIAD